ncbi:hypothetical protein HWV62_3526, partial [Athelia sp. TMB]
MSARGSPGALDAEPATTTNSDEPAATANSEAAMTDANNIDQGESGCREDLDVTEGQEGVQPQSNTLPPTVANWEAMLSVSGDNHQDEGQDDQNVELTEEDVDQLQRSTPPITPPLPPPPRVRRNAGRIAKEIQSKASSLADEAKAAPVDKAKAAPKNKQKKAAQTKKGKLTSPTCKMEDAKGLRGDGLCGREPGFKKNGTRFKRCQKHRDIGAMQQRNFRKQREEARARAEQEAAEEEEAEEEDAEEEDAEEENAEAEEENTEAEEENAEAEEEDAEAEEKAVAGSGRKRKRERSKNLTPKKQQKRKESSESPSNSDSDSLASSSRAESSNSGSDLTKEGVLIEVIFAEGAKSIATIMRKPGSGPMPRLAPGKRITFEGVVVSQST